MSVENPIWGAPRILSGISLAGPILSSKDVCVTCFGGMRKRLQRRGRRRYHSMARPTLATGMTAATKRVSYWPNNIGSIHTHNGFVAFGRAASQLLDDLRPGVNCLNSAVCGRRTAPMSARLPKSFPGA
jgi:hypothetical protein